MKNKNKFTFVEKAKHFGFKKIIDENGLSLSYNYTKESDKEKLKEILLEAGKLDMDIGSYGNFPFSVEWDEKGNLYVKEDFSTFNEKQPGTVEIFDLEYPL